MRKIWISALLFPILLALTVPAGSQTRPRRVTQPETLAPVANSETNSQERIRTVRTRTPAIREGGERESRWGLLFRTAILIGASAGASRAIRGGDGGSCGPSRGVLLGGPRMGPR
jgi:hypothetical protein